MELSAEKCRAQVAIELARASQSPLENVRLIAQRSATAWGAQVLLAEARERRRERTRVAAFCLVQERERVEGLDWHAECENPDRGFASL